MPHTGAHAPAWQRSPYGQSAPQLPQLRASVAVSTHEPAHSVCPVAQLAAQPPSVHTWPAPHAWLQVLGGALTLNGQSLSAGDGAAVSEERELVIEAGRDAEFLLFDLA